MTLRKYIATIIGITTLTVIGAVLASDDGWGAAVCIAGIIAVGILNIFDTVWTARREADAREHEMLGDLDELARRRRN